MTATHTLQRTMEELRKQGYIVEKVEQPWNMYTKKRKDLFGMIDAIAISPTETIGVQACSRGEMKAHEKKIREAEHFALWCASRSILLMGWSKKVTRNKDGKKSKVKHWTPTSYSVLP